MKGFRQTKIKAVSILKAAENGMAVVDFIPIQSMNSDTAIYQWPVKLGGLGVLGP